ncbi:MAG: hypothetical protein WC406_01465 [Methanoregula sp.]|jgi:hypothetical protein
MEEKRDEAEEQVESPFEEVDGRAMRTFDMAIEEFIERENLQQEGIVYRLWKFDTLNGENKQFAAKYVDCPPPDEDAIGREHGGGKYMLIMHARNPKTRKNLTRVYKFVVHARYDDIRSGRAMQEYGKPQQQYTPVHVQTIHERNPVDMIGMLKALSEIIGPLINRPISPVDQSAQIMDTMTAVMKRSLQDQFNFMAKMRDQMVFQPTRIDEKEEEEESESELSKIIGIVTPLIERFVPSLLGGGVEGQVVAKLIKSAPEFKKLMKNKGEYSQLVSYLDETQGREKVDQVLAALKIERPTK